MTRPLTLLPLAVLFCQLATARPAAADQPTVLGRGPYTVEIWGRTPGEARALLQQAHQVAGAADLARVGGEARNRFGTPFLGKLDTALAGAPIRLFDRVAIEPRALGQREVELSAKDRTLHVRPRVGALSGRVSVLSAETIERRWDSGDAVGLSGLRLLSGKVRQARKAWQLLQPVSPLRVFLRQDLRQAADALAARLEAPGEQDGRSVATALAAAIHSDYTTPGTRRPLAARLLERLGRATADEVSSFVRGVTGFLREPANQGGMADAVFAASDEPLARVRQSQSALVVLSQVMNSHKIDVSANLALAGNRGQFTRYLAPVASPEGDRQTQRALVAASQVMTRDDIRVRAQIGLGQSLATAAAEHALSKLAP